jgi:predicted methyltransferase
VRRTLSVALIAVGTLATTNFAMAKPVASSSSKAALAAAVDAPSRTPANVARDKYRKPAETLAFFGIKPTHHVVEIWPGGGWYTEILAPFLAANGKLTVAPPAARAESVAKRLDANAAVYGKVARGVFPTGPDAKGVAWGSADAVLTFRNVHNWRMGSGDPKATDYSESAFRELFAILKPGGVLGIEDHRLPESASAERERNSGYIKVSTVRALAEKAGFKFAGSSEVNANPRDTKDYPKGVWTLPPSFAEQDKDKAKYAAIGESDRMTLKFVKPLK